MSNHLRSPLRRLFGHPSAVGLRGHTSVLLWPNINIKETVRRAKGAPRSADQLLQAAENRARYGLEQLQRERAQASNAEPGRPSIELKEQLSSKDLEVQLCAARACRRMLSVERDAPIQDFVAAGLVGPLVRLLGAATLPELQLEAAWALTNITSGTAEQTRLVIEHGALPILLRLIESVNDNVSQQAIWALGNIAGDSAELRDRVLESGGLESVAAVLTKSDNLSVLRNGAWALSNFCRGRPSPALECISPAAEALHALFTSAVADGDEEVLVDACWAASFLADSSSAHTDVLVQAELCPQLIRLLLHSAPRVQGAAIRAVSKIAAGNEQQTQALLRAGALPALAELLETSEANRKDACWAISNITDGSREHIQEVVDSGVLPKIISLLRKEGLLFKIEAAWAIGNAVTGGSASNVEYLVQNGCIEPLVDLLGTKDVEVCAGLLGVIERILCVGKEVQERQGLVANPFAAFVQHAGGQQKIEALQAESSEHMHQQATAILAHFSSPTPAP